MQNDYCIFQLRRLNVLADDTNTVKVERQWLLLYKEDIILIINNKLLVSDKFYGITYLYVENNMSKSPQVYSWSNRYQLFYGYGMYSVTIVWIIRYLIHRYSYCV